MMSQDDNITQKDLLKLLVDQAQHSATREELNRVEDKLTKRIDDVEVKLIKRIDGVEVKLTNRIDGLEQKMDSRFSTLKTTISFTGISSVIALGGLMVALAQMLKP